MGEFILILSTTLGLIGMSMAFERGQTWIGIVGLIIAVCGASMYLYSSWKDSYNKNECP